MLLGLEDDKIMMKYYWSNRDNDNNDNELMIMYWFYIDNDDNDDK